LQTTSQRLYKVSRVRETKVVANARSVRSAGFAVVNARAAPDEQRLTVANTRAAG